MRVIPEGSGIRRREFVDELFAGFDRWIFKPLALGRVDLIEEMPRTGKENRCPFW